MPKDLSGLLKQNYKPTTVIKLDGSEEPFEMIKVKKWVDFATKMGVGGDGLLDDTLEFLPSKVSSEEIHQSMITACLDKTNLEYARIAARLLYATLRKHMTNTIGVNDKDNSFKTLYDALIDHGVWDKKVMPKWDDEFESIYASLYDNRFEYWQVKQWMDKYALKKNDMCCDTPHLGAMGIAMAIHGNDYKLVRQLATGVVTGKINLPTPVLNSCRNGDFDSISCCLIRGGDSIESIGVANHIAYSMTAKKAGIGIRMDTRSKGNSVKNGRVKHLGKHSIYAAIDTSVKMFTQLTRGGSATVTYDVYDPEIMELLLLKTQRVPESVRLDKLDYSMTYDNNFVKQVIEDGFIQTKSIDGTLGDRIKARDVLKTFLTARQETGRIFSINLDEANDHTPFIDKIWMSNLCLEIMLPNQHYTGMNDLYSEDSVGETAFCSIAGLNIKSITEEEYGVLSYCLVKTINILIDKAPMMTESMRRDILRRRSIGIGIVGLADYLALNDLSYENSDAIEELAERHYYYLLKASQQLVEEGYYDGVYGIKKDWLPIDTKKTKKKHTYDWESLRGKPRCNSVLVAHMPTESSSLCSNAYNSVYPARSKVIIKDSRAGRVLFIGTDVKESELAWNLHTDVLINMYAAIQAYTDQAISADYYLNPTQFVGGKVPLSKLMREFVMHSNAGIKTMYYQNTLDVNGGIFNNDSTSESDDSECCKL